MDQNAMATNQTCCCPIGANTTKRCGRTAVRAVRSGLPDGTRECAPYPRLVARAPTSVHTACRMWSQTWDGRFCARRLSRLQEGLVGSKRLVVSDRALHCVGDVLKIWLIDWNLYGACRRCVAWPHNQSKSSDHKLRNT